MAVHAQHLFVGFSQDWMETTNGLGFGNNNGFSQSLQQQQQQQLSQFYGQVVDPYLPSSLMGFSSESLLALQIEKQRQELDRFITLQNERLRITLQQQSRQHQLSLLRRVESKTVNMLRQKDEELAKATRKTMELEDCIRKVEMENQAWQTVAIENESMAIALNNTLEQVRENETVANDAESCCCESPPPCNQEETTTKKMICKGCNAQNSCVLFLPCRHLCSCKSCESLLDYCPVCKSVKKACIDVLIS